MIDNKSVMAENLKRLMQIKGVNATEICNTLDFKHNTFSDWVNGRRYPRIDKIEMMANYFGVDKSELIEPYSKVEKIKEMREQFDRLNAERERLDKEYKEIMLDVEMQEIIYALKQMDIKKKKHVLEYLKLLNKELNDEG